MEKKDLKNLDSATLVQEIALCKKEIFNLKLSMFSGQVKDVSQFRKLRKKIAQSATFLTQKAADSAQSK